MNKNGLKNTGGPHHYKLQPRMFSMHHCRTTADYLDQLSPANYYMQKQEKTVGELQPSVSSL